MIVRSRSGIAPPSQRHYVADNRAFDRYYQTRRVHVHRRRSRWRTFRRTANSILATTTGIFLLSSLLQSYFSRRTLSVTHVQHLSEILHQKALAAVKDDASVVVTCNNLTVEPADFVKAGITLQHYVGDMSSVRSVVMGSPPMIVSTRTVYLTPVESLSIVTYPSSSFPVLHARGVARCMHFTIGPNRDALVKTNLRPNDDDDAPRQVIQTNTDAELKKKSGAFMLHVTQGGSVTALVYHDGPLLMHDLINSLRVTIATADAIHLVSTLRTHMLHGYHFFSHAVLPNPSCIAYTRPNMTPHPSTLSKHLHGVLVKILNGMGIEVPTCKPPPSS